MELDIQELINNSTKIYSKNFSKIEIYYVVDVINYTVEHNYQSDELTKKINTLINRNIVLEKEGQIELVSYTDFVSEYWKESEIIRKELEAAENNNDYVKQFFKKYGTLNYKFHSEGSTTEQERFISSIIYGGKYTPNDNWNCDLLKASIYVYPNVERNNYSNRRGEVNSTEFQIELSTQDLCSVKEGPSIEICHQSKTLENNDKYSHNYTTEEWNKDKEFGLEMYLSHAKRILNDNKILYNEKYQQYHQIGSDFILLLYPTYYFECEIIDDERTKFRDSMCEISKIKKLDKECTKEDVIQILKDNYLKALKTIDIEC